MKCWDKRYYNNNNDDDDNNNDNNNEQHISYASTSEIPRSSERIRMKEDPKITLVQNILWTETKKRHYNNNNNNNNNNKQRPDKALNLELALDALHIYT